ncbi:MAG: c-type cytochrome, partial [Acidimicrobiia bacterium]|nr:c-type cytochrome [Acidimicrobiia bacterium]
AATQTNLDLALGGIEKGADSTAALIAEQEHQIELVKASDGQVAVVGTFPDDIKDLFQAPGTCTEETAALVGTTCSDPAPDADRDGVADAVEGPLTQMAASSLATLTGASKTAQTIYGYSFDPANAFTNEGESHAIPDLDAAAAFLETIQTDVLLLNVTVEREDAFLADLESGLEFLLKASEDRLWEVDFGEVASDMGVSEDDAREAAGLFNAYCARCHTGGYSAGAAFEQGAGSGAWGPSLRDGRAVVQFPSIEDHMDFVVNGSEDSKKYGINGLGTGRMPSFGQMLSERQVELIVKYERTL